MWGAPLELATRLVRLEFNGLRDHHGRLGRRELRDTNGRLDRGWRRVSFCLDRFIVDKRGLV